MENKNEKIAAVVVTYNRKGLLKECLDALLKQTYPLDSIVIMDNASTDGTEEMLKKEYLSNPIFDYVNLGENLGGAGGFHYGIKRAYKKGYDWFWLMDDDGVPNVDCLEQLLIVSDRGFHYLAPNLIDENGISHFKRKFVAARTDVINYRGGPFNGILLSMELIKAIGFPMRRFFIWGDELEYVNRIEEAGFHVATVQKAIHFHKRPNTFRNPKRGFYFVRNRIYCYRLFQGIYRSKLIYLGGSLFEIFRFTIAVIKRLKLSELIQIIHGFFVGWKTNLDAEKVESQWWGIDLHKND